MLKVVLNDLLVNLKKNWVSILFSMIWVIMVFTYVVNITFFANGGTSSVAEDIGRLALIEDTLRQVAPIINGILLIDLLSITKKIPLRLTKGMFVCAAGEKEKMKYIYLQLAVKIIFGFIFIFAISYFLTGIFFGNQGLVFNIIQLTLWFFIILNVNLKVGIGEQGLRKKDIEDYIIYSKEEEIVNYYWICLLILEVVIFYTIYFLNVPLNLLGVIGWTVAFIINVYIAYRCTSPILKKSLSYEDVYRQIPETKEGY